MIYKSAEETFYKDWCKKTKRNGGVLIGSSIKELLAAHEAHVAAQFKEYASQFKQESQKDKTVDEKLEFMHTIITDMDKIDLEPQETISQRHDDRLIYVYNKLIRPLIK